MMKIRILLMCIGSLLAGWGLFVTLGAAVPSMLDTQATFSPLDQSSDVLSFDNGGFAPDIVPTLLPGATVDQQQLLSRFQPHSGQGLSTSEMPGASSRTWTPNRIVIPAIGLDAPIVLAKHTIVTYDGERFPLWEVPDLFAAGWATNSAPLGVVGNTVLFGHHNTEGQVFKYLERLERNDLIVVYSDEKEFTYIVMLKMILPERNEPMDVKFQNARWILPSADERLTLLTCWPYTSNTHRLILVALPIVVPDLRTYPFTPRLTP